MRVAVVGAGIGGLVAMRWLLVEGLDATAFERTHELGGVWNAGPGRPSYRSLVANVSREKTSLTDHPLRSSHDYPPRAEVHRWIAAYADRFDLRHRIRFGHEVGRIAPRWSVDDEPFDAVVIASGLFSAPRVPRFAGTAAATVIHAVDYDSPERFAGSNVVVVGGGSSAADIAVELSRAARRVSLSTRGPLVTTPKTIRGAPVDRRQKRWLRLVPPRLRAALTRRAILGEWRRRGIDLARVPSAVRLMPAPGRAPTPSEDLLPALVSGAVRLRPAIERIDGRTVRYADGTSEDADTIVCATGYEAGFPFLSTDVSPIRDGRIELYRHVFHPDEPTLAFVGFTRVSGPVPPIEEVQARWVARVLAGKGPLPSREDMRREIDRRIELTRGTGAEFQRVQYVDYLDEIGDLIGVRPRWWRSPLRYWFGNVTAEQYR
jgi:cation diffusion facilitator CzcD-associated flavoprotein CzcO